MLSNRHAAVTSFARTSKGPRKTAICGPQYRASTSATARRGAVQRIVSCSAVVEAPLDTQTSSGSPPTKPPQQDKALGGGDDSGDKAPGWLQAAIQAGWAQPFVSFVVLAAVLLNGTAAFADAMCGIFGWHASLATKADVTEAKDEVKDIVNEVKQSVDSLKTLVIGQGFVCAFVAGLCIAVLCVGQNHGK